MKLKDKVAVITGAASGIGRATVGKFLKEGAGVLATDVQEAALQDLAERLNVPVMAGDVSKRTDAEAIVRTAVEQFGRLDVLVNSAGITARNVAVSDDFETRWDQVMRVNVKGTMLMCHAAVEAMRNHGGGAIVNLGSIMGVAGYPTTLPLSDGFNPYPSSKGAVAQLTRDMGVRLAREGIRVNAVGPGFVYTSLTQNATSDPEVHAELCRLHPQGRMGNPMEIANVIAFLASDEASFVTGALWMVDGGYSAQ